MKENKPRSLHSSSHISSNSDRSRSDQRDDSSRRDNYHRHGRRDNDRYDSRPRSSRLSFYLGQIFGLIYNLAVLYFVYILVQQGNQELALKVFFINATVLVFAIALSFVEKKIFRKGGDRRFKRR